MALRRLRVGLTLSIFAPTKGKVRSDMIEMFVFCFCIQNMIKMFDTRKQLYAFFSFESILFQFFPFSE